MNHEELARAYHAFFVKSEAGQYYVDQINLAIKTAHEAAEDEPEHSRDFAQRAKGLRTALDHITSVGTEVKKGRSVTS
jgi:hypothetical protein